ncbi:Transcription factor HBP-1a [Carex littledalei]|uniref:Transcription factor HBP-1a n=1 Tax=Carex littledalei TaxID=544730 RepID=A0A833V313_9POAL|nr:Transcription factor HBP-1a [Carex littledalei]
MEYVNRAALDQSGSDLKPETGMVEMEIDAARALADMAVTEPDPQEKDVKIEGGEAKAAENAEKEKAQEKTEAVKVGTSTSQTQVGRRGKQNLTEAEREAKRLCRILANRESARQTILRRQALREGLAREVAALSSENQHMKMKKEMAMQEYLSLKETNRKLKEQLVWLTMSQLGAHYMWGPRSPQVQNYIKCDPNASGSGPFFYFSRNSSLNPRVQEIPSRSETVEEKRFLPNALETEVSCSLTLGLDTENKLETPAIGTSDDKIASMAACSKDPDVVKIPPSVKAAAEARRKRREIIKLKKMYRKE